jgi:hypothetical protein
MLNWNAQKVKNLSGAEIWLFIIGRVLIGFGAGAIFARFYPQIGYTVGLPVLVIGVVLLLVASKGMGRKISN